MSVRSSVGGDLARKQWELKETDPSAFDAYQIAAKLKLKNATGLGRYWRRNLHKVAMFLADGGKIKVKYGKLFYPWDGAAETISALRKIINERDFEMSFMGYPANTLRYMGMMVEKRCKEIHLTKNSKDVLIKVATHHYYFSRDPRRMRKKRDMGEFSRYRGRS